MNIKFIDPLIDWKSSGLSSMPWELVFGMGCWAEIWRVENLQLVFEPDDKEERTYLSDAWIKTHPEMEYVYRPVLN